MEEAQPLDSRHLVRGALSTQRRVSGLGAQSFGKLPSTLNLFGAPDHRKMNRLVLWSGGGGRGSSFREKLKGVLSGTVRKDTRREE